MKQNKADAYWIQVSLVICALVSYAGAMVSLSAVLSTISPNVFAQLDMIELAFISIKANLTVLYAVLLLIPLFVNLSPNNKWYETAVTISGYFLGMMSILIGFGFIIAYASTIAKVTYLFAFMIGLAEVVTGVAVLAGKFMYDYTKTGKERNAYAVITR